MESIGNIDLLKRRRIFGKTAVRHEEKYNAHKLMNGRKNLSLRSYI